MKQYFLKAMGLASLVLITGAGFAQVRAVEKSKDKVKDNDEIIIRKKSDKDTKVVIEIKDGDVTVNGKSIEDFDDENVSIAKRKSVTRVTGTALAPTRFRTTWDNDDHFAMISDNSAVLGVTTAEAEGGVKVSEVTRESGAEKAGLKSGDVITSINDIKVEKPADLTQAIGKFKPNDKVTVNYKRDGKSQKSEATLKARATTFTRAFGDGLNGMYTYSFGGKRFGIKAQETEDDKGVKVLDIDEESIAEKAGIKEGDIITEVDGVNVKNVDDLRLGTQSGLQKTSFKVKLNRDGKSQDIEVKIPKKLKTANL